VEFWNFSIDVSKPVTYAVTDQSSSLGEYLKYERTKRRLRQREVAKIIDVTEVAISNWERNRTTIRLHLIPKVIEFLGYDPHPIEGEGLVSQVKRYQRKTGLSVPKIAKNHRC